MILDIPCRLQAGEDYWVYVAVGDHRMPLCKLATNDVLLLNAWNAAAQEQYAAAQTGPQPGAGGPYPEGSQE